MVSVWGWHGFICLWFCKCALSALCSCPTRICIRMSLPCSGFTLLFAEIGLCLGLSQNAHRIVSLPVELEGLCPTVGTSAYVVSVFSLGSFSPLFERCWHLAHLCFDLHIVPCLYTPWIMEVSPLHLVGRINC
jgi:hypothetical protein